MNPTTPVRYDLEKLQELEVELTREFARDKQDRPKRTNNGPKRRKPPKGSTPGCGIAGRRKRQWNW